MTKKSKYTIPILISIFHWTLTIIFHFDKLFFAYDEITTAYIIIKILFFCSLIAFYEFIFYFVKQIIKENINCRRGLKFFVVYFSLYSLLLLVLWPGTWMGDDVFTLINICEYQGFFPWQHVLSGMYLGVLLQYLPFPAGIIILQNVLCSACISFYMVKITENMSKKASTASYILLSLPFFMPPVIMYQFSGFRMGIYIYIEFLLLFILYCAKEKFNWSLPFGLFFCLISILVTTWRTESFIYLPIILLVILLTSNKAVSTFKKTGGILLITLGFLSITMYQNHSLGDANYKIISLLGPGAELIKIADPISDSEELEKIGKVVDLELIFENSDLNGESLYHSVGVVKGQHNPSETYTAQEYSVFVKSIVKLSLKYPKTVFAERLNLFGESIGLIGSTHTNTESAYLYDSTSNDSPEIQKFKSWLFVKPLFVNARKNVILFLAEKNTISKLIFWNGLIPILALLIAFCLSLAKRKVYQSILYLFVLAKLGIIILTQPSNWFMYILTFYLIGNIIISYSLFKLISGRTKL